jgi:hypothetical protein
MKVFISYSHTDEALARNVAEYLQAAGLEVWDDQREILPGDNWADKVAQALRDSDAMVVLLTPNALRSRWIHSEIEYALGEKRFRNRLIPVLVGPPEKLSQEDIPWILHHFKTIRLSDPKNKKALAEIAHALLEVVPA